MKQNLYKVYQFKGSVYFDGDSYLHLRFKGEKYTHTLRIMSVTDKDFHKQFIPLYLFTNPKIPYKPPTFISIESFTHHYRTSLANIAKISLFRTWTKITANTAISQSLSKNKWDAIITIKHDSVLEANYGWLTIYPKDNHQGVNLHIPLTQLSLNVYNYSALLYVREGNPICPSFACFCTSIRAFLSRLAFDGKELPETKAEKALLKCKDALL